MEEEQDGDPGSTGSFLSRRSRESSGCVDGQGQALLGGGGDAVNARDVIT